MEKRKTNFDLLRIFATFGIIVFHHFGNRALGFIAGLPEGFAENAYFYDAVNNMPMAGSNVSKLSLLMDLCYGHFGNGGNFIFMLITGYFLFGRDVTFPKRVRITARVLYAILFHGIVLTVINLVLLTTLYPFSSYETFHPLFTLPNWFSGSNLWYLQAYGCFILVVLPLLKLFEKRLTRKVHLCLVCSLTFLLFLAHETYFTNLWLSIRIVQFILFYFMGGYIAKYCVTVRPKTLLLIAGAYLAAYFLYEYYWRYSCAVMYEPSEYSYVNLRQPFVCCLIYAALCFLAFDHVRVPGSLSKIVRSVSDKTIGVYILHFNLITISFLLGDYLGWHDWTRKGYFLFVLLDSVVLFIAGVLIDSVRKWTYTRIERKALEIVRDRRSPAAR